MSAGKAGLLNNMSNYLLWIKTYVVFTGCIYNFHVLNDLLNEFQMLKHWSLKEIVRRNNLHKLEQNNQSLIYTALLVIERSAKWSHLSIWMKYSAINTYHIFTNN